MDIATDLLAKELVQIAGKIKSEVYGPDIDFNEDAFLEDMQKFLDVFDVELQRGSVEAILGPLDIEPDKEMVG